MTGLGIVFDGHVLDGTKLAEVGHQILFGGVIRQTADEQFTARKRRDGEAVSEWPDSFGELREFFKFEFSLNLNLNLNLNLSF